MISCVIDVRPLLKTKQTQALLTHPNDLGLDFLRY